MTKSVAPDSSSTTVAPAFKRQLRSRHGKKEVSILAGTVDLGNISSRMILLLPPNLSSKIVMTGQPPV
jgi:hypothetical protein